LTLSLALAAAFSALSMSASTVSQTELTTDSVKHGEPAIIEQQLSGTNYTVVIAIDQFTNTSFALHAHTRDSSGNAWDPTLPAPLEPNGGAYPSYGDPFLGKAADTAPIHNNRIYSAGTANTGLGWTGSGYSTPSAVAVWYSDDSGRTWTSGAKVAENASNTSVYIDKPSLAVSQYQYTSGEVFVAYSRFTSGSASEIHVARSTDGGLTFPQDACVSCGTGHTLNSGIVMVDARNGAIYAMWVDLTNSTIYASASTNDGANWSTPSVVATGTFSTGSVHSTTAETVLMAKYNTVTATITATWHAWSDANRTDTDIFFATKSSGVPWNVGKLQGVTHPENDQFFPALDTDNSGNTMVAYYSRAEDGANIEYRLKNVIVKSTDGTVVRAEDPAYMDFSQPPTFLTNPNQPSPIQGWVGDYHDLYFSNDYGRFLCAWIGQSSTDPTYEVYNYGLWY
jgi:hypothetical protein